MYHFAYGSNLWRQVKPDTVGVLHLCPQNVIKQSLTPLVF